MASIHIPHPTTDELTLTTALLIYTSQNNAVIMRGDIRVVDHVPQILNPEPITDSFMMQLMELHNKRPLTMIPENVVAMTSNACAWLVPAQERVLHFNASSDKAINHLSGQSFPQPPLLFITQGRTLKIYALAENKRPTATTPLYAAPYWNTASTVCLGNSEVPDQGDAQFMKEWEDGFYGSNFTHPSGMTRHWTKEFTHLELWEAAKKHGQFKPEWLIPLDLTAGELFTPRGLK